MIADSERKRAKHTRSKRGCTVCRIRKVRCDETRPACKKCTSTGRKCDFPQAVVWKPSAYTKNLSIQPRHTMDLGSVEERSFAYFNRNTSEQFAAPFGNEFWTYLVLQLGNRERCVRQAAVALGALHESFANEHLQSDRLPKPSCDLAELATKSYASALRELNRHIVPDTYDGLHISLLCCIMFTSFEWLRGSYTAATTHLKSGLHILRQWSSSRTTISTPTSHFVRTKLVPMFIRFSVQARSFSSGAMPMPWLTAGIFASSDPADSQNEKQHLSAARAALDILCSEIYLHPSSLTIQALDLVLDQPFAFDFSMRLSKWFAEYHMHLLPAPSAMEEAPRPKNVSLTLWYTMLSLLQTTSWNSDPMTFDAYTPQFSSIVYLSKLILSSGSSPTPLQHPVTTSTEALGTPRFRIDMEIVPMLYHVASRCREPSLRREAIALLRSGVNREGLWDGWAAARLAEEIMAVEEQGLDEKDLCGAESIPEHQRVYRLVEETDLQARTTRVRFGMWGEKEYGGWRTLTW